MVIILKKVSTLKLLHLLNIIYFLILTFTHKNINEKIIGFPDNIINRNNITLNEDVYDYIYDGKLNYDKGEIINFTDKHVEIKRYDTKYKNSKSKYYTMNPDLIIMATVMIKKSDILILTKHLIYIKVFYILKI